MSRVTEVFCDVPGCTAREVQEDRAGTLPGWLRREVIDTVSKELVEGWKPFSARLVLHICPEHLLNAAEVPSPETHPEVIEFLSQPDARDGSGTDVTALEDPEHADHPLGR